MTKKSDAPAIRFKGFSDAWEQRKVLSCIQKITDFRGRTPKKLGMDWSESGYLALSALNVKDGYIDFSQDVHYGDQALYDKWMSGNELHKGQVLFTTEAPMGNVAQVPDNRQYILSQRTIAFDVREDIITENFLATLLRSPAVFNTLTSLSSGGTAKGVSQKSLAGVEVRIPVDLREQALLATYFHNLDNLITLHQRQSFSHSTPDISLSVQLIHPFYTSSWEQRKLSEIADKVTEKNSGLQYVETFTNSAEFGIISQRDFFDHDIAKLSSLDGYYIVKNEDFVYNPRISTSAPVGPINRNKLGRTGVMSPLYTVFRPHDVDTTYLEHFFKCAYWHSFMNFNGDSGARSDRFSIKNDVFFQMPIPLPHIDEQRKIGELLTCLDHLITLHQRELEKLQNIKKSMLEKMFV